MTSFFDCIAKVTQAKNAEIRVQNVWFTGKRKSQDEFLRLSLSWMVKSQFFPIWFLGCVGFFNFFMFGLIPLKKD